MSTAVNGERGTRAGGPPDWRSQGVTAADRSFDDYQMRHLLPLVRGISRAGLIAYVAAVVIAFAAGVLNVGLAWRVLVVLVALGGVMFALERDSSQRRWISYGFRFSRVLTRSASPSSHRSIRWALRGCYPRSWCCPS
ncbi:MAG: hypothetical protein WDN30_13195 [Pararobbsia sp.]